ncbi:efflux RND transporter periplasmic adaptor subunit [Taylorella equigenitalis]|uniref:efflux RND transporter periplasmic adaptor subunit n=1 Tax=Taylorella equigenitalis TaxID=29575 RepID=UPI000DDAB9D9|nr:efflux RND transporter periplasmic adaptor subunit [Taylorella equigenitalis]RBA26083.1 efflux RND transporter periplasmic adaptor subunit [Taylorella equigenitalis]
MIRKYLFLFIACIVSFSSIAQDKAKIRDSNLVSAVNVIKADLYLTIDAIGNAVPSEKVIVRPQISGPVTKKFFKDGDFVNAGDPLFEIDSSTYKAELNQIKAQSLVLESKLITAQKDLKRYQILFKQDSIARQQVEKQQALVNQLDAELKGIKAQVAQAQINLDYTTVKAPIDGRLGISQIDVGNIATTNSEGGLVSIINTNPMEVEFSIPDKYISKVAPKFYKGVELKVDLVEASNGELISTGKLVSMDNQIDTKTGSVKLKASFDNSEFMLFPNQFVSVKLIVEEFKDALAIKNEAIQYGKQGAFVFRITSSKNVELVPIKLGISYKELTQILSGLNLNDRVVLEGVDRLKDGSSVDVVD